jgi:hypothetical protein
VESAKIQRVTIGDLADSSAPFDLPADAPSALDIDSFSDLSKTDN